MRKFLLAIFLLVPFSCFPGIVKVAIPEEYSRAEKERVIKCLNQKYDNVTEADVVFGPGLKNIQKERYYRGFFKKIKLLRGKEPVEIFFYSKHGECYACHEAGMAVVGKGDVLLYSEPIYGEYGAIDIGLIEYDDQGTCVFLENEKTVHAGGVSASCRIIRLNSRKRFEDVYSNSLGFADKFGDSVEFRIFVREQKNSRYRNIIINEFSGPQPIPTVDLYIYGNVTPPAGVDRTISINMKKYDDRDRVEDLKGLFFNLFRKK